MSHLICPLSAGLCPDWVEWDPKQPVENAREAMQQADDWLGVPQVRPPPSRLLTVMMYQYSTSMA